MYLACASTQHGRGEPRSKTKNIFQLLFIVHNRHIYTETQTTNVGRCFIFISYKQRKQPYQQWKKKVLEYTYLFHFFLSFKTLNHKMSKSKKPLEVILFYLLPSVVNLFIKSSSFSLNLYFKEVYLFQPLRVRAAHYLVKKADMLSVISIEGCLKFNCNFHALLLVESCGIVWNKSLFLLPLNCPFEDSCHVVNLNF